MSRGPLQQSSGIAGHRDYGATSSTGGGGNSGGGLASSSAFVPMQSSQSQLPDVNFAGFSPTEFVSLSESIGQNINTVKSSWQALEKAIKFIGTHRDNAAMRERVHQIHSTTNTKVQITSKDLQRLTAVVRRGDKQQKLLVEKLTSDFKQVVEKYSQSQQMISSKMKATLFKNLSQQDDQQQQDNAAAVGINSDQYARQQLVLQQDLQLENDILVDRSVSVQQIEADVLDVNQIMKELSVLINLQGEQIDTIENSIDHAVGDVEAGTSELAKAAQSLARYRRKVLILVVIAVIIGIVVSGIIASQLKS